MWTHKELEQRFATYSLALDRRHRLLAICFWSLAVAAIVVVIAAVSCTISKNTLEWIIGFILISFAVLAAGIVGTAGHFHRKYGVFCPACGKLLSVDTEDNAIEKAEDDGIAIDMSTIGPLKCVACKTVVSIPND